VSKRSHRSVNKKHLKKVFKLKPDEHYGFPYSAAWEIEDREPTPEDVFVVLEEFKVPGIDFYRTFRNDRHMAKIFGGTIPPIYGYKTTEKKPVDRKNCLGTYYSDWRSEFTKKLAQTPEAMKYLFGWQWSKAFTEADSTYRHSEELGRVSKKSLDIVIEAFG